MRNAPASTAGAFCVSGPNLKENSFIRYTLRVIIEPNEPRIVVHKLQE